MYLADVTVEDAALRRKEEGMEKQHQANMHA